MVRPRGIRAMRGNVVTGGGAKADVGPASRVGRRRLRQAQRPSRRSQIGSVELRAIDTRGDVFTVGGAAMIAAYSWRPRARMQARESAKVDSPTLDLDEALQMQSKIRRCCGSWTYVIDNGAMTPAETAVAIYDAAVACKGRL